MSGFGERFRRAGFDLPKPLIEVEGKRIIEHVVELFDEDSDFIFVVNQDHLEDSAFQLRQILEKVAPKGRIIAIAPHRLGPVHACLAASSHLDLEAEIVVNYADFSCLWNFEEFVANVRDEQLDGAVPAYRGFHPHSAGTTNYAYIQETNLRLTQIREKQPFTSDKTQEFASTGTYFFRTAGLMVEYFEMVIKGQISVSGEFYASSAFDLMAKGGLKVGVFEVQHFMQWGTPEDLAEYCYWSEQFRKLAHWGGADTSVQSTGDVYVLASGKGQRFSSAGYTTPKPALSISGSSLLEQVIRVAEPRNLVSVSLAVESARYFKHLIELKRVVLDETEGQASSAELLLSRSGCSKTRPLTILPSDTLFAHRQNGLEDIIGEMASKPYVIPWVCAPTPNSKRRPESYGWLTEGDCGYQVHVKERPPNSNSKILSGAFTFSSVRDFNTLYQAQQKQGKRVNGEFYLDTLVGLAIELGFDVRPFEPEFCVSLGTPFEFETFRYWQSAFDKWSSHPYSLEKDPFVDSHNLSLVRDELDKTRHLPEEWVGIPGAPL